MLKKFLEINQVKKMTLQQAFVGCVFIIFSLIIDSCKTNEELSICNSFSVETKAEEYNTDYFFSKPKLIFLETIPESFIAEISKIYIRDNYLYILDKKTQKVFIFNDQGKFIRLIKNRGNGPGEYIQIIDIAIDSKGRLVLYADLPGKIIFFSDKGDFLYEKKLKESYMGMAIGEKSFYFLNFPTKRQTLTIINIQNGRKIKLLKSLPEYNNIFLEGYSISSTNNVMLTRRFDACVYSMINDSIKIMCKIDFGKSFITENFLSQYAKSRSFFKKCFDNNIIFTLVNTQLILDKLVFNTNLAQMHIISTKDEKVYSINRLVDSSLGINVYPSQRVLIDGESRCLGFVFYPELLMHISESLKNDKSAKNPFCNEISNINENSNPLLVLYMFK